MIHGLFFVANGYQNFCAEKVSPTKPSQEVQGRNPRKLSVGTPPNNGPKEKGGSGDINYGHCWYLCEKKTGSYILKYVSYEGCKMFSLGKVFQWCL